MDFEPIEKVGIVGLGHMGASLAGALTPFVEVVGYDPDSASAEYVRLNFGAVAAESVNQLVESCDIIFIASPTPSVLRVRDQIARLAQVARRRPVVCDIASVKAELELDGPFSSALRYVSLHPMAGREGNGARSADPAIFTRANWALVLTGHEEPEALAMASKIPLMLGCGVVPIELSDHDRAIAMVSTLPHVSAVALGRLVGQAGDANLLRLLAAGSIRDGVRVARTEPSRIVEMLHPNRSQLMGVINELIAELEACRDHLDDEAWLLSWTELGNEAASAILARPESKSVRRVRLPELMAEFRRMAQIGSVIIEIKELEDEVLIVSSGGETGGD